MVARISEVEPNDHNNNEQDRYRRVEKNSTIADGFEYKINLGALETVLKSDGEIIGVYSKRGSRSRLKLFIVNFILRYLVGSEVERNLLTKNGTSGTASAAPSTSGDVNQNSQPTAEAPATATISLLADTSSQYTQTLIDTPPPVDDQDHYATMWNDSITKRVGKSGGKITGVGLEMIIPQGALDEDYEIKVRRNYWKTTENKDLFRTFEDKLTLSPVVEFKPHDLTFKEPVFISLHTCYRPDPMFTSLLQIVHRDNETERLEENSKYREAKLDKTGKMTFSLTHFSDVKVVCGELPRRKVFQQCYRMQLPDYENPWLRWLIREDHLPISDGNDKDTSNRYDVCFGSNFDLTVPSIKLAVRAEPKDHMSELQLEVAPPEKEYEDRDLTTGFSLSFIMELRGASASDPRSWRNINFQYVIEHSDGKIIEEIFPLPSLRTVEQKEQNVWNIHSSKFSGSVLGSTGTQTKFTSRCTDSNSVTSQSSNRSTHVDSDFKLDFAAVFVALFAIATAMVYTLI